MDPTIFLLHGLGPAMITGYSLIPLQLYLSRVKGMKKIHTIQYPVNTVEVDEMVDHVDKEMRKHCDIDTESIILIGQSMGGVVANRMHTKGWNITQSIYIGSPLNGARLLNNLHAILPVPVRDHLTKPAYTFLMEKPLEVIPPHPYHTISMSWPFSDFDGCVFRDEATLTESNHTHLAWADHRTIFLNPRLWYHVGEIMTGK